MLGLNLSPNRIGPVSSAEKRLLRRTSPEKNAWKVKVFSGRICFTVTDGPVSVATTAG
jgi:hypothetical protein